MNKKEQKQKGRVNGKEKQNKEEKNMSGKQFTPVALYIGSASNFGQSNGGASMDPLFTIDKCEPTAHFDNSEMLQSLLTLQKTVEAQSKVIENLQKLLETQHQTLISHGILLKSIAGQQTVRNRDSSSTVAEVTELQLFPFDSLDALQAVENNLDNIPYDDLISYIKNFIKNKKLTKCISTFFTTNLLLAVNWDGTKGKTPLKKFTLFNGHIYDAFQTENPSLSYTQYEAEMKLGLKMAKNRHYKQVCHQKHSYIKAESTNSSSLNMDFENSNDN